MTRIFERLPINIPDCLIGPPVNFPKLAMRWAHLGDKALLKSGLARVYHVAGDFAAQLHCAAAFAGERAPQRRAAVHKPEVSLHAAQLPPPAVRSARYASLLTSLPVNFAGRLTGSPITPRSAGSQHPPPAQDLGLDQALCFL